MVLAFPETAEILYLHTVIWIIVMAKSNASPRSQSSYEVLGMRLQKAINNPMAQQRKYAVLERLADDQPDDWVQILEELSDTDNVTVAYRDDGSVQVFWTVVKDD